MANTYENKYLDGVGLTHLWAKIKEYANQAYTLPTATSSALGGVKLGSDTVQTVAAVTPATATASRTYAVQANNSGQLVVNVPWTDTQPDLTPYAWIHAPANLISALTQDLLTLFQTNGERRIQRVAESSERTFFNSVYEQIKNGGRVAGLIIANSSMCAYLQFTLLNEPYLTFTVMNVELGAASYGYIVEYNFNSKVLLSEKTRLATQYDLDNYAATEAIKDRITYITYAELKALRDEGGLVPGQQYQITDYITTTNPNDGDIQSAGHRFDIIVVADNAFTLNENARATYHKISNNNYYDNYFLIEEHDKQILTGAQFKEGLTTEDVNIIFSMTESDGFYSTHNSAQRIDDLITFTNPEGKEVPTLVNLDPDQIGNDAYYVYIETSQFVIRNKSVSIQYKLVDDEVEYTPEDLDVPFFTGWGNDVFVDFSYRNNVPVMYKTDSNLYPLNEVDYGDCYIYVGEIEIDGEEYNLWEKEEDGELTPYSFATQKIVSNNRFIKTIEELKSEFEYATYDKWQEYDVPKDRFNPYWHYSEPVVDPVYESIQVPTYKAALLESWEIKYSLDNNSGLFNWVDENNGKGVIYYLKDEYNNIAFYDFKNIRFYNSSDGKFAYTFGGEKDRTLKNEENLYIFTDNFIGSCFNLENNCYYLGQNIFYGNQMDASSCDNRIGNNSNHNIFKENCNNNKIGNYSEYNTFSENCNNNFLGDYCSDIYLASFCCNNIIHSNGGEIKLFGNNSSFNYFESTCAAISIGNTSSFNYFKSCCDNIYIRGGNNNSFGSSCQNIKSNMLNNCIFENNIKGVDTNCDWENIHIESGVQYVDIKTQDGRPIYNATFSSGIEGISSTNKKFISANSAVGGDKIIYHPKYTTEILLD